MSDISRRRARRGTNPGVWIAAIIVAVGFSGLAIFLASRSSDGGAAAPVAKEAAKEAPKKAARPSDCDDVSERTVKRYSAKVADVTLTRCKEDGWSAKVRTCLAKSESNEEYDECLGKLAPNQTKQLAIATSPAALGGEVAPKNVDTACSFAADAYTKVVVSATERSSDTERRARIAPYMERLKTHQWNTFATICTQDKWPSEVVECITKLKPEETLKECFEGLPRDLRDRFDKEISRMVNELAGSIRGTGSSGARPPAP